VRQADTVYLQRDIVEAQGFWFVDAHNGMSNSARLLAQAAGGILHSAWENITFAEEAEAWFFLGKD
jgi:hypothetical protein